MRRKHFTIIPIVIALAVMAYQYFGSEKVTNPVTGKKARVALSQDEEKTLGLQSFNEVLSHADVIQSGIEYDFVSKVAGKLLRVTGEDAKDFKWELGVVQSEQQNAFCLPAGKIVVFTGILPVTQTEAGLATVIGHEMAHAIARHGSQRLLSSELAQTALVGASFSMSQMDVRERQGVMAALGAGAQYGILLPFSRKHEEEADQMGLIYMARAGYDPREAIPFWERMSEANGKQQPPEFASTHPSNATRIENLKAIMPQAMAEFEKRSGK